MYKSLAKTLFVGKNVIFLPSCHSTNDEAVQYTNKGRFSEGSLVITDNQTAGKGQRGNTWESASEKNLTFSFLLKPTFLPIVHQFDLNICVSLGIVDYLSRFNNGFQVKWPNDIYYYDKKICGILIQNFLKQNRLENSIVGVGLNVNQQSFSTPTAISLSNVTGKKHVLQEILEELCGCIEAKYLQLRSGGIDSLKNAYLNRLYWFGEDHIFSNGKPFSGRIVGISEAGKLEVESKYGLLSFGMKEVEFLN